jgi:protein-S-isoprenylcysteine O-methyltransferase Ste14
MKKFTGEKDTLSSAIGKSLYGLLFIVILPAILVYWAKTLDRSIHWSVPPQPAVGILVGVLGLGVLLRGMADIFVYGRGLPMNAYPPEKYVTKGVYALFAHPIYIGAVFLAAGNAFIHSSSSGLYIVTPLIALMLTALVIGYEQQAIQQRLGSAMHKHHPLFSLPAYGLQQPTWVKKLAMLTWVFVPWLVIGYLMDYTRCGMTPNGVFLNLFNALQLTNPLDLLWLLPYVYIFIRILFVHTETQLRQTVISGTITTGLSLYLYLVLPPLGASITTSLGFLVISIVTTLLAMNYSFIWSILRHLAEIIANSRRDYLFANGRFRIINHSIYAGLGAAVGVGIVAHLIGNNLAVLLLLLCSVIGAAVFAQVWWGSRSLLRPFGYWGAVLGGMIGAGLVHFAFDIPLAALVLAGVLCAPLVQAIGRLRCLTQGCCHGIPTDEHLGIRVWQPQSRVCTLSGLKDVPLHITQLYSILFNLLLAPLLWAMWSTKTIPASIIIGMYLVLTAIERFAEDAYRGETQTKTIHGLKESQWVAIVGLLAGLIITMIPSGVPASATGEINLAFGWTIIIGGFISALAMGMDFPQSTRRFSRLSG